MTWLYGQFDSACGVQEYVLQKSDKVHLKMVTLCYLLPQDIALIRNIVFNLGIQVTRFSNLLK